MKVWTWKLWLFRLTYFPVMQIRQKVSQCSTQLSINVRHLAEDLRADQYITCIIYTRNPKSQDISSIARCFLQTETKPLNIWMLSVSHLGSSGAGWVRDGVGLWFQSTGNWPLYFFLLRSQCVDLQHYPKICSSLNPSHPIQIHVLQHWNMELSLYQKKSAKISL